MEKWIEQELASQSGRLDAAVEGDNSLPDRPSKENLLRQLLREYLSYGYLLHPLKPGSKVPLLSNWPEKASRFVFLC
ncbi:MAG: hypothetical protein WHT09_16245 [Thermogutta sp.]